MCPASESADVASQRPGHTGRGDRHPGWTTAPVRRGRSCSTRAATERSRASSVDDRNIGIGSARGDVCWHEQGRVGPMNWKSGFERVSSTRLIDAEDNFDYEATIHRVGD